MKKEFAVLVDHKASYKGNEVYKPVMIEATDVVEAMNEAENFIDEEVYLVKILERKTNVEKVEGGKRVQFEEVLVNRGHGWRACDAKNGESSSTWNKVMSASRTADWMYWEIESTKWC